MFSVKIGSRKIGANAQVLLFVPAIKKVEKSKEALFQFEKHVI
jgi:hypothetical protein